jgi:hypothetical protein
MLHSSCIVVHERGWEWPNTTARAQVKEDRNDHPITCLFCCFTCHMCQRIYTRESVANTGQRGLICNSSSASIFPRHVKASSTTTVAITITRHRG